MAFVATPNGVMVKLLGVQNGIPVVNIFHLNVGTSPTPEILSDIADDVQAWASTDLMPLLHSSYTLNSIYVQDISVANGAFHENVLTTDNVGENGGSAAAANAATVVSFGTGLTGRSFRGRFYIGALPQSFLTDAQHIYSSVATDIIAAFQALINAMEAAGYVFSVLSKIANGVARAVGILTEVTTIATDTKVDSQRRRTAN